MVRLTTKPQKKTAVTQLKPVIATTKLNVRELKGRAAKRLLSLFRVKDTTMLKPLIPKLLK